MTRVIPVLVAVSAVGVAVACWIHFRAPSTPSPETSARATPAYDEARADAARLPIKGWDR